MIKSTTLFALIFIVFSCSENKSQNNSKDYNNPIENDNSEEQFDPINPNGSIIKTRFNLPHGYERVISDSNSFGSYLQNLPLKKDGSLVHLHDGTIRENDGIYLGVVDLPIGKSHECADAVMRLRSEYLFSQKKYSQINFLTVGGKNFNYINSLNGKQPSKTNLWKYWEALFNVANTTSLNKQLKPKSLEKLEIGDVFIYPWNGNAMGHAIIVVDKCINPEGKVKFMVAQSYFPAREIHVLNNPNENGSPWYDLEFGELLETSELNFTKNQLKSF
jgi:hypothetical protein